MESLTTDQVSRALDQAPAGCGPVIQADFCRFSSDLFTGIRQLHAKFGPLAAIEDRSQRVVFLFCPKYNQQVLSDPSTYHARFFAIRGPKKSAQRRLTGGLLSMNGQQHRRNRRLVKEPFSLRAVSSYGPTVARLADEMLVTWQPGKVIDMAEEMRRFMLRVTSTLLFGFDRPRQAYRIGDMLDQWVAMNHKLGSGALVPDDLFNEHYEELLAFAERLEREIMDMLRQRRAEARPGRDVLSILVRAHDELGGLSDEELVGQAAVLFGAAHMTTAHSLAWTLFLLAQHPAVMHQLEKELATERHPAPGDRPHVNSGSDGESHLDRVIKESMRILPASAYSQRVNMQSVTIGPLQLPRGTGIVFTPLVIHHLPEIYDEPQRFDPDRWLGLKTSPYEYLPFGAGPRMCIGGPLALAIIHATLPAILRRYRLTVEPGARITAHVEGTMLAPATGIPMRVQQADGQFESSDVTGNIHDLVELNPAPDSLSLRPR